MKRFGVIVGGIVLLVVLAGGAYVGSRLLAQGRQAAVSGGGGGGGLSIARGGPGGSKQISIDTIPAPELPQTPPDERGIYVRSEDRSIYVGTGQVSLAVSVKEGGAPETSANYDGPVVEVVVNQDTVIYRDTTEIPEPDAESSGEITVQQTVEPGAIEDIGEHSMVQVWGKKTGDRIVAQTLVYSGATVLPGRPADR